MSELTIDVKDAPVAGAKYLTCAGEIDAHTCGQMDTAFTTALDEGTRYIIVDLSRVSYMASRGLGVFLNARKLLESRGGNLILVAPNDIVESTIGVLGFDSIFTIVATEAEAVKAAG